MVPNLQIPEQSNTQVVALTAGTPSKIGPFMGPVIVVSCDQDFRIIAGDDPTADATCLKLYANNIWRLAINAGKSISVLSTLNATIEVTPGV